MNAVNELMCCCHGRGRGATFPVPKRTSLSLPTHTHTIDHAYDATTSQCHSIFNLMPLLFYYYILIKPSKRQHFWCLDARANKSNMCWTIIRINKLEHSASASCFCGPRSPARPTLFQQVQRCVLITTSIWLPVNTASHGAFRAGSAVRISP